MADKQTEVNDKEFLDENVVEGDELTLEELDEGTFIKGPAVGENVVFNMKKMVKKNAHTIVNPKTKKPLDIGLSKVDYYYQFVSDEGKTFDCTTWQIFGKTKAICKKLKTFDFTIKIDHIADGRETAEGEDAWNVFAEIDGAFKQLDKDSNEWVE